MNVKESLSLKNKSAIVTGGAGLIGPRLAEALGEAGARVMMTDIDEKRLLRAAGKISKRIKKEVLSKTADVTDPGSVRDLVGLAVKKFRGIDILVNAAMGLGKSFNAPVESYSLEDWDAVMSVNVLGTFLCSRACAGVMKKHRGGSIINIGSIYGVVAADQAIYGESGINSPAVYAASKGAVIQMTRYLAAYWAPWGIRVNAISPGGVLNGQDGEFIKRYSRRTPMGRMLEKDELKGAVVYLASRAASYVTGHNLMVDGGWTAW